MMATNQKMMVHSSFRTRLRGREIAAPYYLEFAPAAHGSVVIRHTNGKTVRGRWYFQSFPAAWGAAMAYLTGAEDMIMGAPSLIAFKAKPLD